MSWCLPSSPWILRCKHWKQNIPHQRISKGGMTSSLVTKDLDMSTMNHCICLKVSICNLHWFHWITRFQLTWCWKMILQNSDTLEMQDFQNKPRDAIHKFSNFNLQTIRASFLLPHIFWWTNLFWGVNHWVQSSQISQLQHHTTSPYVFASWLTSRFMAKSSHKPIAHNSSHRRFYKPPPSYSKLVAIGCISRRPWSGSMARHELRFFENAAPKRSNINSTQKHAFNSRTNHMIYRNIFRVVVAGIYKVSWSGGRLLEDLLSNTANLTRNLIWNMAMLAIHGQQNPPTNGPTFTHPAQEISQGTLMQAFMTMRLGCLECQASRPGEGRSWWFSMILTAIHLLVLVRVISN